MMVLELFSGTASFSNQAKEYGHKTFTVDINKMFNPNLIKNILELNVSDIPFKPNVIWASPPCECFSVASISRHWKIENDKRIPQTSNAKMSMHIVSKTVELITKLQPDFYFIENPVGMLRKLNLIPFPRKTCCYCRYGDIRMKPTDIWTNLDWLPKMCYKGCKDHEQAPRGSKTGTQGLKNRIEKGRIPKQLCNELLYLIGGKNVKEKK